MTFVSGTLWLPTERFSRYCRRAVFPPAGALSCLRCGPPDDTIRRRRRRRRVSSAPPAGDVTTTSHSRRPTAEELQEIARKLNSPTATRNEAAPGTLPPVVADRMLRRMLAFGGVPFGAGIGAFAVFFVLRYRFDTVTLPGLVGYTTLGMFGLALLGLTYGIMSASWDADRGGSWHGWGELRLNYLRALDGVQRARQEERMEEPVQRAGRSPDTDDDDDDDDEGDR
ncbi:hypothetical protein CDCA_CDCA15G3968 [Cyanidium caldarium]|uniref:DUF3464 family protein n=1 Tax=Cyanidium caldarium TaxID=2771 RepID=A0AAV9J029_CYACA|nr:hypothetical protein CDCA_CDCA15G3968 [Cyanidium caldarium]